MNRKYTKQEMEEAKQDLRELLPPGSTVYTIIKHVSRPGMYRVISLYVIRDNKPRCLDWLAARFLEGYDEKHEGCKASGCGMDMGFHLVYNLGRVLYHDGFPAPAGYWRNHSYAEGELETDGGYALKQEWLS